MGEKIVSIIEKPDEILWDDLYKIIYEAHAQNRERGLRINTKIQNGEQLRDHIGEGSKTFVLLENGQAVGTISARIQTGKGVFLKGKRIVLLMHLAVLPEYSGNGYGKILCGKVESFARDNEATAILLYVVDHNNAKQLYKHIGYKEINFVPRLNLQQNTVYMAKWLTEKDRPPELIRKLYFAIKKIYVQLRYRFQ